MELIKSHFKRGQDRAQNLLKIDFVRFGIVGVGGFSVSFVTLFVLHGEVKISYWIALLISNEAGLLSNFVFHETWTYKNVNHKNKPLLKKFLHFHMSSWSGIAIIFGLGLLQVKVFHLNYLLSQAIASGVAMFWNFFWTKYFVFKSHTPGALLHPETPANFED